jgi:hypothetical protein
MKKTLMPFKFIVGALVLNFISISAAFSQLPPDYKGKPFEDSFYKKGAQVIPGKVELGYYDLGGEGIAYHDFDSINQAGGKLNYEQNCPTSGNLKPGDYICHFREKEGVDVSYTKDLADFKNANFFEPPINQFYIGWEADGEWINYTVNVKKAGKFKITALYGNNDNKSSLWINNVKASDITLPKVTGSMHIWNKAEVGSITFPTTGLNLLTLHLNKGSNLAYFEFELVEEIK